MDEDMTVGSLEPATPVLVLGFFTFSIVQVAAIVLSFGTNPWIR